MSRLEPELKSENLLTVGQITFGRQRDPYVKLIPRPEILLPEKLPLQEMPDAVVEGTFCVVQLTRAHGVLQAQFHKALGSSDKPGIETDIACLQYGVPTTWPKATLKAADAAQQPFSRQQRSDLTKLPFVTIDDASAKDHDDAIYCERQADGFCLWVAIADVSHYVHPGDALDEMAKVRGTSVYFPGAVVPMLPEILSTDLCSLKPDVERPCLVCEMVIDRQGQVSSYRFYEAIIRSAGRLTYNGTEAVITKAQGADEYHLTHASHLRLLHDLYQILAKARAARGALDVDLPEPQFNLSESGRLKDISYQSRGDAHRLIEECMIAANVCAALFLRDSKAGILPLYRVHESPEQADHVALAQFSKTLGIHLSTEQTPLPKDYRQLATALEEKTQGLSLQILKAMAKAQYSSKLAGHFGLALEAYTHFTSPIRRYADLWVHRAIKASLPENIEVVASDQSNELIEHINTTSRRADWAERFAQNWLKCTLMEGHIGESFDSKVVSVQAFGVFVELVSPFVQGMVHISTLGQDYFHYDAQKMWLVGERSGKIFRMGDALKVELIQVDQLKGRLTFVAYQTKTKDRKRKMQGANQRHRSANRKRKVKFN